MWKQTIPGPDSDAMLGGISGARAQDACDDGHPACGGGTLGVTQPGSLSDEVNLNDAWLVEHHWNAELGRLRGGTDTRQHQNVRRADRPRRHNDFATATRGPRHIGLRPAHAGGALALEDQAFHQATGFQPQIFPDRTDCRSRHTRRCAYWPRRRTPACWSCRARSRRLAAPPRQ